jgi:hypothetical protein
MRIAEYVVVGFDTVVDLVIVAAAIAGIKAIAPHVNEFKQFASMLGIGKKK